ncbi:hypothetical protein BFJ71_g17908, partial [Fusarium oxysporum]
LSGSTPRPDVPAIPAGFSQRYSPETSPQQSSEREQPVAEPSLTLLPSTVYQSPARPPIPRSMSAPIPDKPGQPPARFARKKSVRRIEEVVPGERRRSHEDPMPPPPPPAPPVLKELRHLASPPPPLPAPLQHAQRHQQAGAVASGMIEIVMDDDLSSGNDQASEASPPAATHKSHNRGRSIRDSSSISGSIHKATERLRSASRSRKEYVRSPPFEAPYESISMTRQMKSPPP